MKEIVYLDNAATTQMDIKVIDLMKTNVQDIYANPSSIHSMGRKSKYLLENSRVNIADVLNVKNDEIYFTSNATEANNIVINSLVYDHKIDRIITTNIEHPSVWEPINALSINKQLRVDYLPLDEKGDIDMSHLEHIIGRGLKTAVSLMHGNNEIGNLNDINQISKICKENNALFHSDMVQTIGHYDLDFSKINLDFATFSPHKFHGPKGVGVLYKNDKIKNFSSFILGGSQEKKVKPGTENIHAIPAAALSLNLALYRLKEDKEHILNLKKYFISRLLDVFADDIYFLGRSSQIQNTLYTIVNVSFPKKTSLDFILDTNKIAVSKGSVCNLQEYSNVVKHIDNDYSNRSNIRFSFSRYNNISQIDYVINVLKKIFY